MVIINDSFCQLGSVSQSGMKIDESTIFIYDDDDCGEIAFDDE